MRLLSQQYIQALADDERNYLAYADITLYDDTELHLTNEEIWMGGFQYEDSVSNDDSFTAVGAVVIGSATLILNNIYDDFTSYDFNGAEVVLFLGIESANDKIRIGTYTVESATHNGATIQLNLLDFMESFDEPYSLSTLAYPATIDTIISDACTVCGVSWSSREYPNKNFVIQNRPLDEAATFRDVLSWVASIVGGFIKAGVFGQLEVGWFNQDALENFNIDDPTFNPEETGELYDETTGLLYLYSLYSQNIATEDVIITGVATTVRTEEEEVDAHLMRYMYGEDGFVINLEENPFITTTNALDIVTNLGERIVGLRFRKLNISHASNPAIQAGDVAVVIDRKGNIYKTLITRTSFSIGSPQISVCGADTPAQNSATLFSSSTKDYVEARQLFRKDHTALATVQDTLIAASARIDNIEADYVDTETLEANYAHITDGVIDNAKIGYADVNDLNAHYASITNGVITNATIDHADVNNLNTNYAHITSGVIDNATISYADVDNLSTNYAHISSGTIDNASIGHANVTGLNANYAHITNGFIDNADIKEADVENLTTKYAHITNGYIDNANIKEANVENLTSKYAHITQGVIDNAKIGYADVNGLNAHYATIDMANVNNAWIENGVVKDAAISDAQIIGVSANKLTAGTIDANNINVANLRAKNLIVEKMNGQPILGGYELVNKNSTGYSGKNPSNEGWYEYSNGTFVASTDATVNMSKAYYKDGTQVALYDQTYIDGLENNLQQQIDGAIETFTGSVVPTLVNYPAVDWTSAQMANHVGDIYYVVNAGNDYDGYSYRFSYDNSTSTYSWRLIRDSGVTAALADISDLQTFQSNTESWITETDEGLETIRTNHTSLSGVVNKTVKSSTQLWFTKANTTAPSAPTSEVTSDSTSGNAWRRVVPTYNASYPYYFYCWQYKYVDNTFGWSAVIYDQATTEAEERARTGVANAATADGKAVSAQNTANANIKSSVQLWFTKANTTAPSKPSSQVTNNSATGSNSYNKWNLVVPVYNSSYPYYYYCYQQQKGDGTYQWSDVVYDQATSEAMKKAQEALPASTFTTFESTTFKNVKDTVDEQSSTITNLSSRVDTKADSSTVTTLSNTVSSVSQTATSNSSKLSQLTTTLGTNADGTTKTGDVMHRMTATEQDLSGFKTTVSQTYQTKNDMSNYSTTTQMNSAINQKANEITLDVAETYTSKADFDNLEIGGRNLIGKTYDYSGTNQSESGSIDIYRLESSSGASSIVEEDSSKKTKVLHIEAPSTMTYVHADMLLKNAGYAIDADSDYILSFYIKGNCHFDSYLYTSQGDNPTVATVTTSTGYTGDRSDGYTGTVTISTNSWTKFWVKWHTKSDINKDILRNIIVCRIYKPDSGTSECYISEVMFEKGNKPSDWTPAPEDVESYADSAVSSFASRFSVTPEAISSEVQSTQNGATLVSRINQTASSVKIEAEHVEIDGTAVFNAISSDVDSAITDKGYQTSSQVESAITNKGYQTASQVSTAIGSAIDDIEIGGRNLIVNTDLTTVYTRTRTANATGYTEGITFTVPRVEGATNYVVSFDMKSTVDIDVSCYWYSPNTTISGESSTGQQVASADGHCLVSATTEWKRYWVHWVQSDTASTNKNVIIGRLNTSYSSDYTVSYRAIKMEAGNKATAWSPAPEDVDSAISAVGTIANGALGSVTTKDQYYLSTSSSSATGGSWQDTVPTWSANKYIWTRVATTKTPVSGSASTTYSTAVYDSALTSALSTASSAQSSANSAASTVVTTKQYYLSTSTSSATGGTWGDSVPTWASGKYIWVRFKIVKTPVSGTATTTYSPSENGVYDSTVTTALSTAYTANAGLTDKADKTAAVSETQRIYYRSNAVSSGVPVKPNGNGLPTAWVTATGDVYNTTATNASGWSRKVTPISNGTGSSVTKYLYLWTCIQKKTVSGTVTYGDILLDDSTTVIDGGKIITGSVSANAVTSAYGAFDTALIPDLNASKITAGTISVSRIPDDALNSNIQVGGRNLLIGSSTAKGWTDYSTFDEDETVFTIKTSSTSESTIYSPNGIVFEPGETYTVSCWAKSNGYVSSMEIYKIHSSGGGSHQTTYFLPTTSYQKIVWTFVCNAETEEVGRIRFDNNGSTTSGTEAILYIKEPKLERGNKATDWSPAPEDINDAISSKKAIHTVTAMSGSSMYSIPYATILATSVEGHQNWLDVNTVSGISVGDTVRIAIMASDMNNAVVYLISTVTEVLTSSLKGISHGLDTTVIDGGHILTGTIDANSVNISNLTVGSMTQTEQNKILNSQLSIGGRNILTNTREFILPDGYSTSLTTNTYNGCIIRYFAARAGSSYRSLAYYNGFVPVSSGGTYTQSFWAKGTGKVKCFFYGGNIDCVKNVSSQDVQNTNGDGDTNVELTSEWKRYWVTHTLNTSTSTPANKNILLRVLDGDNEVYVCGWKLEEGNKATAWSPAPEDLAATASDNITQIDSNGIWVTPSGKKPASNGDPVANTTTGTKIDGAGVGIYKDGNLASKFTGNGVNIYDSDGELASFARETSNGVSYGKLALNHSSYNARTMFTAGLLQIDPYGNDVTAAQNASPTSGIYKTKLTQKGMYNNNNTTSVGSVCTGEETAAGSGTDCTTSTWTMIDAMGLYPGTWIITFGGAFASDARGMRYLVLDTVNSDSGSATREDIRVAPANGGQTSVHATRIVTISQNTTYYLKAYQNSGTRLAVSPVLKAVQIM